MCLYRLFFIVLYWNGLLFWNNIRKASLKKITRWIFFNRDFFNIPYLFTFDSPIPFNISVFFVPLEFLNISEKFTYIHVTLLFKPEQGFRNNHFDNMDISPSAFLIIFPMYRKASHIIFSWKRILNRKPRFALWSISESSCLFRIYSTN